MPSIKTAAALAHLAAELRATAGVAAGPDGLVSRADQAALDPFSVQQAEAIRAAKKGARVTVDGLVARGVSEASAAWSALNARGPALLSRAEVGAIGKAHPTLGPLTARAAAAARADLTGTPQPTAVGVTSAAPGVSLSEAAGVVTVRAGAEVPVGGTVTLGFDGYTLELTRFPGGLRPLAQDAGVPDGYGCEVLSTGVGADGRAEAALRITRDPPQWFDQGEALIAARSALRQHLETQRVHDPDWQSSFGLSWPQAVAAGVLDDIAAFGTTENAESERRPDRYVFVDRGPLDLYTEVSVRKNDGKILNVYVEID